MQNFINVFQFFMMLVKIVFVSGEVVRLQTNHCGKLSKNPNFKLVICKKLLLMNDQALL